VRYLMANPFLTHVTVNGKAVAVGPQDICRWPTTSRRGGRGGSKLTASAAMKTRLLIGSADAITVQIDGKKNRRRGRSVQTVTPDQESVPSNSRKASTPSDSKSKRRTPPRASSPASTTGSEADVSGEVVLWTTVVPAALLGVRSHRMVSQ